MTTENDLVRDLTAVIAKHASWLDGRTFLACSMRVAEGYFEAEDLPSLIDADAVLAELERGGSE